MMTSKCPTPNDVMILFSAGQATAVTTDHCGRLLDAAGRKLEQSGPEALQARGLTAEVGMSTQAVYTHFGGMPGLLQAFAADGFARFARHVAVTPETDDPVADFFTRVESWTRRPRDHDPAASRNASGGKPARRQELHEQLRRRLGHDAGQPVRWMGSLRRSFRAADSSRLAISGLPVRSSHRDG
jgi:AcrR family transcriptional regulator